MGRRYFGTDGIRGKVGNAPITPDFCLRLSWAVGRVFAQGGNRPHILIGKDTRISGYMLESVMQSGLVSAGADVSLLGPMPTPAIAYLTRAFSAEAGIVISASHNPYDDNGIKFFDEAGNKLSDDVEEQIEALLEEPMAFESSERLGRAARIEDAAGRYVEFCKSCVVRGTSLRGFRIVLDCAHGATYQVAPKVFTELGAQVILTHADPDGFNINDHCGSTYPKVLQQRVIEEEADLGIAFDGDGDRLVMVDAAGRLIDGDQLIFAIAQYRKSKELMQGGVVGTVMSNLGLERALGQLSIPFIRASVGDRYVLSHLHQNGWTLGGEPSGHILTLDLTSTGDAIVAALQVLVAMQTSDKPLADLVSGMAKAPQILRNVPIDAPQAISGHQELVRQISLFEERLGQRGRILVRPSGTEPLLRIMVEGEDESEVVSIADALVDRALAISA